MFAENFYDDTSLYFPSDSYDTIFSCSFDDNNNNNEFNTVKLSEQVYQPTRVDNIPSIEFTNIPQVNPLLMENQTTTNVVPFLDINDTANNVVTQTQAKVSALPAALPLTKRTGRRTKYKNEDPVARKKRNLARKAALARVSRHLKKAKMDSLSTENVQLREELEQVQKLRKADQKMISELRRNNANSPSSSDVEAKDSVEEYIGRLIQVVHTPNTSRSGSPNGSEPSLPILEEDSNDILPHVVQEMQNSLKKKTIQSNYYLDSLEKTMDDSSEHVRFLTWIMTREDTNFYTTGLWFSLFYEHVGANQEQMNQLLAFKDHVCEGEKEVRESSLCSSFKQLREFIEKRVIFNNNNLLELSTILSPPQLALFFAWIKQYGDITMEQHL